jgi:hypothetical protein
MQAKVSPRDTEAHLDEWHEARVWLTMDGSAAVRRNHHAAVVCYRRQW